MQQQSLAAKQFGNVANAYLSSTVHSQGADLDALRDAVQRLDRPMVLDLGCGAGHASFSVASAAAKVFTCDPSDAMLAVVAQTAREKGLFNIDTVQGCAENLPFDDAAFDLVVTRFSAHHWMDVPTSLREIGRVLRPGGRAIVIDVVAPETAVFDTTLQAIELLRDASHVRNQRVSQWSAMLAAAGFTSRHCDSWKLPMRFQDWIDRMRTPPERVAAIRSLFDSATDDTRTYFCLQDDYSFAIDVALFEADWPGIPAVG